MKTKADDSVIRHVRRALLAAPFSSLTPRDVGLYPVTPTISLRKRSRTPSQGTSATVRVTGHGAYAMGFPPKVEATSLFSVSSVKIVKTCSIDPGSILCFLPSLMPFDCLSSHVSSRYLSVLTISRRLTISVNRQPLSSSALFELSESESERKRSA